MRDPHVETLYYRIESEASVTFENPPPVEWNTAAFDLCLEDGQATVSMKEHHPTVEGARQRVEERLRAWEISAGLTIGRPAMRFVFVHADVVDRNPPPRSDNDVVAVDTFGLVEVASTLDILVKKSEYPKPPAEFAASAAVKMMWGRFAQYLGGHEPLLTMAYFCLTVIEERAGNREAAAARYAIEFGVLAKLGRLTSTVGDEMTARKAKGATMRPLTGNERDWIEAVVKAIIYRVGEYDADPQAIRPTITMADFPPL